MRSVLFRSLAATGTALAVTLSVGASFVSAEWSESTMPPPSPCDHVKMKLEMLAAAGDTNSDSYAYAKELLAKCEQGGGMMGGQGMMKKEPGMGMKDGGQGMMGGMMKHGMPCEDMKAKLEKLAAAGETDGDSYKYGKEMLAKCSQMDGEVEGKMGEKPESKDGMMMPPMGDMTPCMLDKQGIIRCKNGVKVDTNLCGGVSKEEMPMEEQMMKQKMQPEFSPVKTKMQQQVSKEETPALRNQRQSSRQKNIMQRKLRRSTQNVSTTEKTE